MLPNLFIPGAPKCGTTALVGYLSTHPQVITGHVKEPNFWSNDMPFHARREGFTSEQRYLDLYRRVPAGTRYAVDASTQYLYSEVAIPRILERFDDARFIVCVRPPAELAAAWHMQMLNAGYESVEDFAAAWRLIERRRQGQAIPRVCPEPRLLDYRGVASVGSQLQQLLELVGRERVHIVPLHRLKDEPRRTYLDLLGFLGLDDDGRSDFSPENPAFRNRSSLAARLVRHPSVRPHLNRAAGLLGLERASRLRRLVKRGLYRPAPRRNIPEELRAELNAAFKDEDRLIQAAIATVNGPARDCREPGPDTAAR